MTDRPDHSIPPPRSAPSVAEPAAGFALPPSAAARAGPRLAIVTCMKNEGPFILDWLAHHRAVGVRDVLVYTNDCDDGTDALLDRLALRGAVRRLENPFDPQKGERPQHAALRDAPHRAPITGAEWVLPIDVDEYVNIHAGAGRFTDLLAACPTPPDLISMPWRLFGSGGAERFEDAPVPQRFRRCAAAWRPKPHHAWGFKTAFRHPTRFGRFGVHRPVKPQAGAEDLVWLDGSGRPMPTDFLRHGWRMNKRCWGYGLVSLNHYAVRSAESFLVKRARGRVNHVNRDQGLLYWWIMNRNEAQDETILRLAAEVEAERRALEADGETRRLHTACVAAHRRKIAALRQDPNQAALLTRLRHPVMDQLSRIDGPLGRAWFDSGPPDLDAIPPPPGRRAASAGGS